jgi:hypothetical protein
MIEWIKNHTSNGALVCSAGKMANVCVVREEYVSLFGE